jgi:hypothetical protein
MTVKTNWINGYCGVAPVKAAPRKKTTDRKPPGITNYITKPAMARYLDQIAKAIRFGDPRSLETKANELRNHVDSYLN